VIAVDIGPSRVETISYDLASEEDLDSTVKQIEATGQRAVKAIFDVRPPSDLQAAADAGQSELGKIEIVCANAGIGAWAVSWEITEQQWKEMIDINLTGVFNAALAARMDIFGGAPGARALVREGRRAAPRAYRADQDQPWLLLRPADHLRID
jgi:NAD(P)-dependent dehydrogenase (short-subunit alcohol dehydrogenase family)